MSFFDRFSKLVLNGSLSRLPNLKLVYLDLGDGRPGEHIIWDVEDSDLNTPKEKALESGVLIYMFGMYEFPPGSDDGSTPGCSTPEGFYFG